MKMSNFWKLLLLGDSDFKMIVCDKEHTLFHIDINPTKTMYQLPWEFNIMEVERISIKGGEMHVWVK